MKKYEYIDVAVWIAAATMTYNNYIEQSDKKNIDINKFYLKQSEINKRAEKMCTKIIDSARISYHYNADNLKGKNTYNYFRTKGESRRVTYIGELNGKKEYPNMLDLNDEIETLDGKKTIKDIVQFLSNEYKTIIKEYEQNKYVEILEFLKGNSNTPYKNPINETDEVEKERLENIKAKGQNALYLFKDMCLSLEDENYKNKLSSKWLDGSNRYVRNYLWSELKHEDKKELPSSISVFAEKEGNKVRFRLSLEIRVEYSNEEEYIRHNRFLNYINVDEEDFEYFGTRNKDINLEALSNESIKEYIQEVKERKANKIQIGKTIDYDYVKNNSADDVISIMKDTVNKLKKYYEIAVQEGDEIQVSVAKDNNSPKNTILYGPPGTGKTYNVCNKALEIIDHEKYKDIINNPSKRDEVVKEFNKLKEDGLIGFCTFIHTKTL